MPGLYGHGRAMMVEQHVDGRRGDWPGWLPIRHRIRGFRMDDNWRRPSTVGGAIR